MTDQTQHALDLLDQARKATLCGDYRALDQLSAPLNAITEKASTDAVFAAAVRPAAERNARLLQMALNGIENVRKRLVDQKQQMANFGTYDAAGHHAVHVMRPESLQQKI